MYLPAGDGTHVPPRRSILATLVAAAAALRGQLLESSAATTTEAVQMYRTARQALDALKHANPKLFADPGTQQLWEHLLERLHALPPVEDKS